VPYAVNKGQQRKSQALGSAVSAIISKQKLELCKIGFD